MSSITFSTTLASPSRTSSKIFNCLVEHEASIRKEETMVTRNIFLVLFLCIVAPLVSSNKSLCPLWQEDPKFIHYRSLMISSSINRIESLLNNICILDKDVEAIKQEIWNIKFNLGYLNEDEFTL
jgi:hypothetical protein